MLLILKKNNTVSHVKNLRPPSKQLTGTHEYLELHVDEFLQAMLNTYAHVDGSSSRISTTGFLILAVFVRLALEVDLKPGSVHLHGFVVFSKSTVVLAWWQQASSASKVPHSNELLGLANHGQDISK